MSVEWRACFGTGGRESRGAYLGQAADDLVCEGLSAGLLDEPGLLLVGGVLPFRPDEAVLKTFIG